MKASVRLALVGALAVAVFPVTVRAVFYSDNLSFEGAALPVPQREVFQDPTYSGSTRGVKLPPVTLPDLIPYAYRTPEWEGSEGSQSLGVVFTWGDSIPADPFTDDPYAWVRLTTNAGAVRPNPSLHTQGKIHFKVRNPNLAGDRSSIGLCVAIRETGVQANLLGNGGVSGPIEWIGVSTAPSVIEPGGNLVVDATTNGDDIAWKVGADIKAISWGPDRILQSVPADDDVARYGYIRATDDGDMIPIPALTIPTDLYDWTQVEVNLATGTVSYAGGPGVGTIVGFTGDGVLSTPNNRAVLEALCITNDAADARLNVGLYIDELQFEAPVADPTPPPSIQGPLDNTDTQVLVDCLVSGTPGQSATLAELFRDTGGGPVSVGTAVPVGGVATFSPVTLAIGNILTAKQTANGLLSPASAPVVVYGVGTVLADSFDNYASQAELDALWQQSEPANARRVRLSTGSASSCENIVVTDYAPGTTVSRLYRPLGGVNGTDAQPLVVAYRYKHDINNPQSRDRFELTPATANPPDRQYGAVGFAFTNGLSGAYGTQYCTLTNFPTAILGYASDYFLYDYARTGVARVPGVWHQMKIEVKTSVVNFYIDGVKVNTPYDDTGNPITTNGVPIYLKGVPRQNTNPFQYVVIGNGYSNSMRSMYDDVSVTLGGTPIPFGDPNPVDAPTVVTPLFPGVTTVNLVDVNSNATQVAVFANGGGAPIGTAAGPFPTHTAAVTVTSLVDGSSITATQTVGGVESCLSWPEVVAVTPVTLPSALVPGQTSVQVSNLEAGLAESVTIWRVVAGTLTDVLGTLANPATDPVIVTVTALVNGDQVAATQTIGGVLGPPSATVTVALPAPTVAEPIVPLTNRISVFNVLNMPGATASIVTVYVNDVLRATQATGGQDTVSVTTGSLTAGQVVKATQTVNGLESPKSLPVTVAFADPPVTTNWIQASTLPRGLTDHQAIYLNGYVYAIGGRSNASDADTYATNTVYYAAVNANGSIGAWASTTNLPVPRAAHGAAAYNGRIYAWGGWTSGYPTINTCIYATQNPNGTLGAWTLSATTIPDSTLPETQMDAFGRGTLNFGDVLYIINGEDNSGTNQNSCYYSKLTAGGDYGPWTLTNVTENNSWFHGVCVIPGTTENYLYRVAGNYRGTTEQGMYRTTINANGSLASWVRDPVDTPSARYEHATSVVDDRLFMLCGLNGATPSNTVFYTRVNRDTGAISGWRTGTPYPISISRNAAVAYPAGGKWYILGVSGGPYDRTGLRDARCYYAEIAVDTDNDTVADYKDNCPTLWNQNQADSDADGVGNACDDCPGTPPGAQVGPDGCMIGDCDQDADVDLLDFADFQDCFGAALGQECLCADLNNDNTVNLTDYIEFEQMLTGP